MLDLNGLKALIAQRREAGDTIIVAVLHGHKLEGMVSDNKRILANPPLDEQGMTEISLLVPTLRELGPYDSLWSSRLARALDTASNLALEFDLDIQTSKGLGQHAAKNGSTVDYYPGYEKDSYNAWMVGCIMAIKRIAWSEGPGKIVLITGHRPTILGMVAACRGANEQDDIKAVVDDATLTKSGYHVFAVSTSGRVDHLGPTDDVAD